jgi:hypothetical protein
VDAAGLPALLLSFERIPGESRAEALSRVADFLPVGLKCGVATDNVVQLG